MTLSTKHRSSLYQSLAPLVGAEEADALLNELPANDGDELVTRMFLRAELEAAMHAQTNRLITTTLTVMSIQLLAYGAFVALVR